MGSALAVINLGIDYFPNATYQNLNYELQTYAGIGATYPFSTKWAGSVEWLGRQIRSNRIGDFYSGVQYFFLPEAQLRLGGSLAAATAQKVDAEYRLLLGLAWSSSTTKVVTERIKTIQKTSDCRASLYQKKISARPLTEKEKKDFLQNRKLPFLSTPHFKLGLLNPGQALSASPAKNELVLFAFDVEGLPAQSDVVAVKKINLSLGFTQRKNGRDSSEIICLIDEKICSGDLGHDEKSHQTINEAFFKGKEPPNDFFARQISKQPTKTIHLPLSRLVENSILSHPISLLYSKTLYFSVSQNLFVHKNIELDIELSANFCTQDLSDPTVEVQTEKQESFDEKK